MADVLTKEQRKKNMQNIRSQNTKIEVILRKTLWHKGYRYRKNYKELPGKPDIVLTKYKIAIFAMGSFFMERIGKYCAQNLKEATIANSGLIKYLETGKEMMK